MKNNTMKKLLQETNARGFELHDDDGCITIYPPHGHWWEPERITQCYTYGEFNDGSSKKEAMKEALEEVNTLEYEEIPKNRLTDFYS